MPLRGMALDLAPLFGFFFELGQNNHVIPQPKALSTAKIARAPVRSLLLKERNEQEIGGLDRIADLETIQPFSKRRAATLAWEGSHRCARQRAIDQVERPHQSQDRKTHARLLMALQGIGGLRGRGVRQRHRGVIDEAHPAA